MRNGWMKFMWPTWPMVGFSAASPVSTRFPPCRPATQRRPRRAWLSAKSRSTLTCRTTPASALIGAGVQCSNNDAQSGGVGRARQAVAETRFGKHLRELREQLQVLFGRLLRHEQHEHLGDGLAVGRVEGDRRLEADESALRFAQAADAPVGNGDALAQAGRAQLLARLQAVDDDLPRKAVVGLEQRADRVEQARLRSRVEIEQDVPGRQQLGDLAHRQLGRGGADGGDRRGRDGMPADRRGA